MAAGHIVAGWYTPDYSPWFTDLRASLEKHRQPYAFVEVPKQGGWETNTLRKPAFILAAIDKYPDKTIVWIDVDSVVEDDLAPLTKLPGDIGLYYYAKAYRGRALSMRVAAGTVVIQPTENARAFVRAWDHYSRLATRGDDDEVTLVRAIAGTPWVSIVQLETRYCAGGGRYAANPAIVHMWASRGMPKMRKVGRFIHRHLGTKALGVGICDDAQPSKPSAAA